MARRRAVEASRCEGFTLSELLIALVVTALLTSGVIGFLSAQKGILMQEEMSASMDANLRIGLSRIADHLRMSGYGVPESNLAAWIPWVGGVATTPNVRDGAAGAPDGIDVALCTPFADTALSAIATSGSTTLAIEDPSLVDTAERRLISIGESESAHVVVVGSSITVDTDPLTAFYQGVARDHFMGAPICRVDVVSFDIDAANDWLTIDRNDGAGAVSLLDGVSDLQVETVSAGREYRITLTVRPPSTGALLSRSATASVTVRNPP